MRVESMSVRPNLQALRVFANARLSRRIVYWVFLSIIVIEFIILIPSVYRRERELLNYLRTLAAAQASDVVGDPGLDTLSEADLLAHLAQLQQRPPVRGGALYRHGTLVGTFGEPPQTSPRPGVEVRRYWRWQQRYDAQWTTALPPDYTLIIHHDARWVQQEFFAFIGRIAALVLIISVFVTGATLFCLRRLLIAPILQLRLDLLAAGQAIGDDSDPSQITFASLHPHRDDELGDVITAFDHMFGQITEAVATRRQSEARFRTLVEQAADAFLVIDRQGRVVDVNQSACDSLGYRREQLLALAIFEVQTSLDATAYQRLWHRLQPGVAQNQEGWHRRRDGSQFPVEVRLGLITIGEDPLILALARDVTERKAAEQAQARLAEIGELAAMVVHEVRSPLTTVLLGLQALQGLDLDERNRRRLALATEESQRLQKLLNEILTYARQDQLERQPIDLNLFVETLALTLRDSPAGNGKHLHLRLTAQPMIINGDRDKLKQVFINLVSNAWEALPLGETVTWTVESRVDAEVTITVHNGGDPIPPEVLPKLTEPFFTTKKNGNGLGLAITRRIVEAHGGRLILTSSAQAGTIAQVDLPVQTATLG